MNSLGRPAQDYYQMVYYVGAPKMLDLRSKYSVVVSCQLAALKRRLMFLLDVHDDGKG